MVFTAWRWVSAAALPASDMRSASWLCAWTEKSNTLTAKISGLKKPARPCGMEMRLVTGNGKHQSFCWLFKRRIKEHIMPIAGFIANKFPAERRRNPFVLTHGKMLPKAEAMGTTLPHD